MAPTSTAATRAERARRVHDRHVHVWRRGAQRLRELVQHARRVRGVGDRRLTETQHRAARVLYRKQRHVLRLLHRPRLREIFPSPKTSSPSAASYKTPYT